MVRQLIKDLLKDTFLSLYSIVTTWLGGASLLFWWFIPKLKLGDKVNIYLESICWQSKILISLGLILIGAIIAASKVYKKAAITHSTNERRFSEASPLEIIFDPNNSMERFWSIEGTDWVYRLEIKNNSGKTLKNVSVTAEHTGSISKRPANLIFDKTKTTNCDINPNCSELVPIVRWPVFFEKPKNSKGWPRVSPAYYETIKVAASANDTKAVIRRFKFNYKKVPMLHQICYLQGN